MQQPVGTSDKLIFANQLRGLAALLVLLGHWLQVFWWARDPVAASIFAPHLVGEATGVSSWLESFRWFNAGAFGVAIFFIISGFVIPFSLKEFNSRQFLVARLFRIYPLYWVGFAVTLLMLWLSARYWGTVFTGTWRDIGANALLVNQMVGKDPMDNVNWSLNIEVVFYLVAALMLPSIRQGKVWPLLAWGLFSYILVRDVHSITSDPKMLASGISWYWVVMILSYVSYMFIGTLFHYHYKQQITTSELTLYAFVLLVLFMLSWVHGILQPQFPFIPFNYCTALGAFALIYAMRASFRPVRLLDFLADLSYPIYVIHSMMGYVLMRIMMDMGISYWVAIAVALALVLATAYALHRWVEMPTMRLGKRLARRM